MTMINTNVISLNAQRNLQASGASLATTIQRLSSGLRINSAKDDAAGLAISERFTAQIRGLNQASRNANDGISLAQTAEGALAEIGNNLQRIRELAVQSSNATNSASDRAALQQEVDQLLLEVDRVASSASFNGVKLLDGSFAAQVFQVGANAGETITVSNIANADTSALGGASTQANATAAASGITTPGVAIAAGGVVINGTDIGPLGAAATANERVSQLVNAINNVSSTTGVGASFNSTTGQMNLISSATITMTGTTNLAAVAGFTNATGSATAASTTGIAGASVGSYIGSQLAIGQMDAALTAVNSSRASLGAIQNRFQSVIVSLNTASENLSASRSRIRDADYAKETAELTRSQILQQAGTAMLAQANAVPQNVLSLLR